MYNLYRSWQIYFIMSKIYRNHYLTNIHYNMNRSITANIKISKNSLYNFLFFFFYVLCTQHMHFISRMLSPQPWRHHLKGWCTWCILQSTRRANERMRNGRNRKNEITLLTLLTICIHEHPQMPLYICLNTILNVGTVNFSCP